MAGIIGGFIGFVFSIGVFVAPLYQLAGGIYSAITCALIGAITGKNARAYLAALAAIISAAVVTFVTRSDWLLFIAEAGAVLVIVLIFVWEKVKTDEQ